ncbi:hypothetical protein L1049_023733 [Liquidambar formosana]|uniref:Uncharacterized protein n=1 Tax=Liquidambar formosana TaxID=63359 RepID=A0AAP0X3S2_LIQFO
MLDFVEYGVSLDRFTAPNDLRPKPGYIAEPSSMFRLVVRCCCNFESASLLFGGLVSDVDLGLKISFLSIGLFCSGFFSRELWFGWIGVLAWLGIRSSGALAPLSSLSQFWCFGSPL